MIMNICAYKNGDSTVPLNVHNPSKTTLRADICQPKVLGKEINGRRRKQRKEKKNKRISDNLIIKRVFKSE
jgi:hypothetical protein